MNRTTRRQLRARLIGEGLTQRQIARQLGISAAYLSMLLSGQRSPSLAVAAKLETLTGIPTRNFARLS